MASHSVIRFISARGVLLLEQTPRKAWEIVVNTCTCI